MTHDKSRDPHRFDYMYVSKYRWESGTIGSRTATDSVRWRSAKPTSTKHHFIIAVLHDRRVWNVTSPSFESVDHSKLAVELLPCKMGQWQLQFFLQFVHAKDLVPTRSVDAWKQASSVKLSVNQEATNVRINDELCRNKRNKINVAMSA